MVLKRGRMGYKSALCYATWSDCGACRNCENDAGTTQDGRHDVCTGVDGGVSWHGVCIMDASAWDAEFDVSGVADQC